jgi:hypothetical protein
VQARQRHPLGRDGGRQQVQHVGVAVAGERGDGHRVISGVLAARGADVGMGVDPDDGQVVAVAAVGLNSARHNSGDSASSRSCSATEETMREPPPAFAVFRQSRPTMSQLSVWNSSSRLVW